MRPQYAVELLCESFCVSRSGYYGWLSRRRRPAKRLSQDAELAVEITKIHCASQATYGSPRIQAALAKSGRRHSRKRVARLMRAQHLVGRQRRRFRPKTTDSRHDQPIAANRLASQPAPRGGDQIWVGDITYIETAEGWLYLAAILDLYSRRIVGWAFADHLGTELVSAALRMALIHRQPPAGLLHHSDRGVQYASVAYRKLLATHGLTPSMSRLGCCYDNAAIEAFFSTVKVECVYRRQFQSRFQAKAEIFAYIETFYNRQRLHSAIGCYSPVDFEKLRN